MRSDSPLYWPITDLTNAYQRGELSPIEVTQEALRRIEMLDGNLHAFVRPTPELALKQADAADAAYRRGDVGPLLGVPVSVKDAFHIRGVVTTLGSVIHRNHLATSDSGAVRRLRAAGAVFTGKTNTAEFGQSATTDNRLGPDTANPWDTTRTPGGSSGGSAASVAAGLSTAAIGSDGGGSVRIPAAFAGLFGFKPTNGLCLDEDGFRAMTDFVSPGPLAWRVADARVLLDALANRSYTRRRIDPELRIGWCARPEGRPVHPGVAAATASGVTILEALGHHIIEIQPPIAGWQDIFGPLVLDEEQRERGHLLDLCPDLLTQYERSSLKAARELEPAVVERARNELHRFRSRVSGTFDEVDLLITPTSAVPAFPLGQRPEEIDGRPVDQLWGAFPFAVPFNVAGVPAASLPCGFVDGLPIGLQIVGPPGSESLILDVSETLEEALATDVTSVHKLWSLPTEHTTPEASR